MTHHVLSLLAVLCLGACNRCGLQQVDSAPPAAERLPDAATEPEGAGPHPTLEHLEIVTGGASPSDSLPMIVAIHGLGSRPDQFVGVFEGFDVPARIVLPRAPQSWGRGFAWFPYRSSGNREEDLARGVTAAAEQVAALVEELLGERPTRGLPVVTGFSQGGMISFALAVHHGALFRAALPVSGWLPGGVPDAGEERLIPPIFALHGDADDVVPIGPARRNVQALNELGRRAELTEYEGVRHTVSQAMRRDLYGRLAELIRE